MQLNAKVENYGQINHEAGKLYMYGTHNHHNGSSFNTSPGALFHFGSGSNTSFKTHTFKTGSTLTAASDIDLHANGILKFENGSTFSGNPNIKINGGSSLQSKVPLTFNSVENYAEIRDTFVLSTIGDFNQKSGQVYNHGDVLIGGKLKWETGNFGNTTETGTIHVTDSTFITGGFTNLVRKTLHLHGHAKISAPNFAFFSNAVLITDSLKTIDIIGTTNNFNSPGFFTNNGILRKMKAEGSLIESTTLNMSVNFTNNGLIGGNGTIAFNQFTNNGIVSPGLSPGTLVFNKFSNTGSTVQLELGYDQSMAFQKDSLAITALPASLGGAMQISLIGGFEPDSGQIFKMIKLPASYTGTFNNINAVGMPNDSFNWVTIYQPTGVDIQYCPTWYADTDHDGHGDFANVNKFTACMDQPVGFVRSYGDCNDADSLQFPGQIWYTDNDGDHYGDVGAQSCSRVLNSFAHSELLGIGDCNDENAAIRPFAAELCDGIDNDCNEEIDTMDANFYLIVTESVGSGPGSLIYNLKHCLVNDIILFDQMLVGQTLAIDDSLLINGLLTNGQSYEHLSFINEDAVKIILQFNQTNVTIPVRVINPNIHVTFKGLDFRFTNNQNKSAFFLENTSNKIIFDNVDNISSEPIKIDGIGVLEIKGTTKIKTE